MLNRRRHQLLRRGEQTLLGIEILPRKKNQQTQREKKVQQQPQKSHDYNETRTDVKENQQPTQHNRVTQEKKSWQE